MPVDVRAKVFCNLGPVISGNISDEALTAGQGLIRCRGQLILKGLYSPAVGSPVTLGYESSGYVSRIPRTLRVLGSFADPFRGQTTVSVGDRLVLLAEMKGHVALLEESAPEVAELNEVFNFTENGVTVPRKWNGACWEQVTQAEADRDELIKNHPLTEGFMFDTVAVSQKVTAAEEYAKSPLDNFLTVKPSLSASFIASKCLSALGIGGSPSLFNKYNVGEFDLSEGYVSVLEKLLAAESKVGYLNEAEALVVKSILGPAGSGASISEDDIIDLGPLNIGTPPADELRVFTATPENVITDQPLPNVAPVANDFRLDDRARPNDLAFTIPASRFIANGFDPDAAAQRAVGAKPRLQLESVTAGQGCEVTITSATLQQGIVRVGVIPNPEYSGVASISYQLTDGSSSSNTASCYFSIVLSESQQAEQAALDAVLEDKYQEANAAFDRAAINPAQGNVDPSNAAFTNAGTSAQASRAENERQQQQRNWEFEESIGAEKIVAVPYEYVSEDGVTTVKDVANFTYIPYSCTKTRYDQYDRKEISWTYQEGITAEVAGSIVKAQIEDSLTSSGGTFVRWLTEDQYFYHTELRSNFDDEEALSEYGQAYEAWKEQERLAWEEAMEKNRIANLGESGLLQTTPDTCRLGFNPPASPVNGDTYTKDGMVFTFNSTKGWVHEKGDYVAFASSFPTAIYTSDLTDVTRTSRERLISYMTAQVSNRYGPIREVIGGLSLPFDADFYYLPENQNLLTDRTVVYYDVDWRAGKTKTTTHRYTINANTIQGQQLVAKLSEDLAAASEDDRADLLAQIMSVALELVYDGAEVGIRTDREYGIQQRPSVYDREFQTVLGDEKPDPSVFGDFQVVDRNAQKRDAAVDIAQRTTTEPRENPVVLNVTPPYTTGPERTLNEDGTASYVPNQAQTQAMNYGRAFNAIARGNRYGCSLQVPVSVVPIAPLSWLYLSMRGISGGYRSNGLSYVFNEAGLICNIDALFWGGVGTTP